MTNKDKLTGWHKGFYDTLSDDICWYCLTEKQVYVIGQALRQVRWPTRWQGDVSGTDLDSIAEAIEEKLADMQTCQDIAKILDKIMKIDNKIDKLEVSVSNIINETNYSFPYGASGDTSIEDVIPNAQLIAPIGGYSSACSSDADRDALYGGCIVLANYAVQKITDLLQFLDATVGQASENLEEIVAAIPVFETFPLDEVLGIVEFLTDHALEVWEATVTDERIQALACLFYCYASTYGDCSLSLYDVADLLSTKLPTGINLIKASIRDALGTLLIGSPIGDDIFYRLIGFEFIIVGQGQKFLDVNGFETYEYRFLSGTNSPDNDWSIFCTSCLNYYRVIETDFTETLGDWIIDIGDQQSNGIAGIDVGDNQRSVISLTKSQDMEIQAVQYTITRDGSTGHGMRDSDFVRIYENDTGEAYIYQGFDGFQGDGVNIVKCQVGSPVTGKAILIAATVTDDVSSLIVIHSAKVWISAGAKIGTLTTDAPPC